MRSESFATRLQAVFTSWKETKLFFEHSTNVSNESLHVFAGVLILLLAAGLLTKPISSRWPWLAVLAFACLNESIDLSIGQWPQPGAQFGESVKDVLVTMLLPSVLLLTTRRMPALYRPVSPSMPDPDATSATDVADSS